MHQRVHAFIRGVVQGVGFRFFVLRTASDLQLTGWVRNCYDGRVEVTAEGSEAAITSLLAALHRGPTGARVSDVESEISPATSEFSDFSVQMDV